MVLDAELSSPSVKIRGSEFTIPTVCKYVRWEKSGNLRLVSRLNDVQVRAIQGAKRPASECFMPRLNHSLARRACIFTTSQPRLHKR